MSEARVTMSEGQLCERLGINRVTAWRERRAGRLPYCRIGRKVVYLERHIDQFLSNVERKCIPSEEKRTTAR